MSCVVPGQTHGREPNVHPNHNLINVDLRVFWSDSRTCKQCRSRSTCTIVPSDQVHVSFLVRTQYTLVSANTLTNTHPTKYNLRSLKCANLQISQDISFLRHLCHLVLVLINFSASTRCLWLLIVIGRFTGRSCYMTNPSVQAILSSDRGHMKNTDACVVWHT
jgi:hypothetical protein